MNDRQKIAELMQDLPADETWLEIFLDRLKTALPDHYKQVMEAARRRQEAS